MEEELMSSGHYVYKECQKNYAAAMGGHAIDGCQEFIGAVVTAGSFWCAACGCHRSFHNRVRVQKSAPGRKSPTRKRRTKFTSEQKRAMQEFAESVGWRMSNVTRAELEGFLARVRVTREVFRIWMHNHRHESAIVQTSGGAAESSGTESDEPAAAAAGGITGLEVVGPLIGNGNGDAAYN